MMAAILLVLVLYAVADVLRSWETGMKAAMAPAVRVTAKGRQA